MKEKNIREAVTVVKPLALQQQQWQQLQQQQKQQQQRHSGIFQLFQHCKALTGPVDFNVPGRIIATS